MPTTTTNNADPEYNRLLELVINKGRRKKNRTGIDTLGVFGAQARFDISERFPLLTTKKVFMKGIVHELLWFIAGDTNIKYLVDNGVNIWNANAFARYKKQFHGSELTYGNEEDYVAAIRSANMLNDDDHTFVKSAGDLGEGTYGGMWRAFPFHSPHYSSFELGQQFINWSGMDFKFEVDQLSKAVDKLKNSPDDRRIIVSAWHPYWVDHCALPPCHVMFHFNTEELSLYERFCLGRRNGLIDTISREEGPVIGKFSSEDFDALGIPKRRLNCLLYQRSCDLFLGVPFNIASYALLTSMVAQVVGMQPGEFIHTYGDLHLYEDHIELAKIQLARPPYESPELVLNPAIKNLFDFKYEDVVLIGYQSHDAIKAKMAV